MSSKFVLMVCFVFLAYGGLSAQPFLNQNVAVEDSSQQIADRITKSKKPVLIDFWAPWCGPCRMLNPIIKDLEKQYKDKVVFMKVNIDIHRNIAAYFRVQAIPAIFIVHDRAVKQSLPGLQSKEAYAEALDNVLAEASKLKASPQPTAEESPKDVKRNETP